MLLFYKYYLTNRDSFFANKYNGMFSWDVTDELKVVHNELYYTFLSSMISLKLVQNETNYSQRSYHPSCKSRNK